MMVLSAMLQQRYQQLSEQIQEAAIRSGRQPKNITLIAVSKTRSPEEIAAVYQLGVRHFGENYVQELRAKQEQLPPHQFPGLQWHFVGHLQRNKAKFLVGSIALIHSVDNLKLARKLSQLAANRNVNVPVLLQVNTSGELTKYGCAPSEVFSLAEAIVQLPNLQLKGLMTLAAYRTPAEQVRPMFALLRSLRDQLEHKLSIMLPELSMGMSNDFEVAIEEGATMIRIGTRLFGPRQ